MKTILCVVMFLAAVGTWALGGFAFAAAPPGGASVLQPYLVTWDHHVGARHGMRQTSAGKTDFINPLLRELAREGHVQNISAMTENSYRLLADGRGAALLTVDGTTLQPTGKSASNDRVTTTLGGTVTAVGGSGISGATVSAFLGSTVLTTTTAAGGTYSFTVSNTGDYQVGVYAPGYEWQPAVAVAVPPGAADVNFALVPTPFTIRGTVTQQGATPLAGVSVYAVDLIQDNFTAGDYTLTDASGNYTLTVSAATYEVRAFAPPLGVKSRSVVVGPSATGIDFAFTAPTLYTVSGVVRKSNGQPLPGGELTISSDTVAFNSCDAWYSQAPTAGADGSYSIQLPAGSYSMYANWPNEWPDHWVIGSSTSFVVSGNMTNNDISLPAVGTIRGTVTDPGGAPLANATVFSWRGDPNASPFFDGFFPTDATGSYVVTATLGAHNLLAFSDNYTNSTVQNVTLSGNLTGVNMQVRNGITIGGQLTGSDSQSLRWARVTYPSGVTGSQFRRATTVYYNGRWKAVLDPGTYTFSVSQPYYVESERQVTVTPGMPDINFTLQRKTQQISGNVHLVTGSGLCDTYMTAADVTTAKASLANTAGDGKYALMVPPGTYNVWPYKYHSDSSSFNARVTVPPANSTTNFTVTEIMFQDVFTETYFFQPVAYLVYRGIASGYTDGTYRPYNNTTRGQLSKLIVLGEDWTLDTSGGPHFVDVAPDNPFYAYIETAYHHGVIAGYSDQTFRWGSNVTRAQLSKIIVLAEGWTINTAGGPHFVDVPLDNPFYSFIETAVNNNIISGYADGTFRPGANATRGQIAKILYNALTQP